MMDTELIFALFRPVHIREDPAETMTHYIEDLRLEQRELLEDLQAEQTEQM